MAEELTIKIKCLIPTNSAGVAYVPDGGTAKDGVYAVEVIRANQMLEWTAPRRFERVLPAGNGNGNGDGNGDG